MIVGGGFGGLAAARGLARSPVEVTLIDKRNHHVFQPLLYQVATASLSPADISAPIRHILRSQANCQVVMGEVVGVNVDERRVLVGGAAGEVAGSLAYDRLVLAAGATHAYFGHDEWADLAPGLKGLEDATAIRRRILLAYEAAEYESSDEDRRAALTFAIVGAGPTGVELAGAIKEIAAEALPRDYRHIDTRTTRVILLEGADRVLPSFPAEASARAKRDLERLGVEVRLGAMVTDITSDGLRVGEEFYAVRNVFWAAGVKASGVGGSLRVETDKSGRVVVGPDLAIPGHPEVFVIGDMAHAKSDGEDVPGVAQGALQMGRHVARIIAREVERGPGERPTFVYKDKGSMAVIGKSKAVAVINGRTLGGFFAWMLWGGVHIAFLVSFRNRIGVMWSWFWNWLLNSRDARLITGEAHVRIDLPDTASQEPDGTAQKPA